MAAYVTEPEETRTKDERKPEPPRQTPQTRRRLLLLGGIVVAAALALGWYLHTRDRVSTDDAQVDGHIIPIAAKISGNVAQVLVNDNQQVKAGDVLVRIDPRDYQARVDQAPAALAAAEARRAARRRESPGRSRHDRERRFVRRRSACAWPKPTWPNTKPRRSSPETPRWRIARANVDSAKATYDRAQADLARMKPLVPKGRNLATAVRLLRGRRAGRR